MMNVLERFFLRCGSAGCHVNRSAKALYLGLVTLECFCIGNDLAYADTIYVANVGPRSIEKFDLSGNGSFFDGSPAKPPQGIVFDGSGSL